ncbi:MAG: hypothetical protein NTY88_03955 [Bacteroidetes bacterium]|nr:hypothetical protein [Bacteroidota bacterium]
MKVSNFNFKFQNLYRLIFLSVACCLSCAASYSQDSSAISANKNFSVKQDVKTSELLYKYKEYNRRKEFTDGYRIQIMYTDIRDEVYKSKGTMYKEFSELASYVEYEQPYFKLRMGDFSSRLEATYFLQRITPLYPGAFIVRDKIKLK